MALAYRDVHGVDSIGLRLTVVYGPGRLRGYMSFPSELIRRAAWGEPIEVPIPDQPFNWQYVEEVSNMIVHCLEAPAPESVVFNTYGDCRTFREAAEVLAKLAPKTSMTFLEEPTDPGQRAVQEIAAEYDDSELRRQLGYQPVYPLERGVAESFAAFVRNYPGEPERNLN
jgi:nucleoside-diphosphate-sugar epimerase